MKVLTRWFAPGPSTALAAASLAALTLGWTWFIDPLRSFPTLFDASLALGLVSALFLATRFPIHIRHNLKLLVMTVPLYLMATLLPPPVAALSAGLGIFLFQLDARKRMGLLPTDIATSVGRWTVSVGIASLVAHSTFIEDNTRAVALVLAAIVMLCSDVIGVGFEVSAMSGESPFQVMGVMLREMILPESVQYLLGILAALVTRANWSVLFLFFFPLVIVYFAFKRVKELQAKTRLVMQDMADAVDRRDPYTGGHSRRVAEWCEQILQARNISGPEAELIVTAARVHDIGKLGVPEELLLKAGPLTLPERTIMQTHVTIGSDLLKRYPNFARGREIVLHHHERWDGMGYPEGLKGMEIPLGARIVAVADSFDAMTSDRPYRRAYSREKALYLLRAGSGRQWDPRIVEAFLTLSISPAPNPQQVPAANLPADSLPSSL